MKTFTFRKSIPLSDTVSIPMGNAAFVYEFFRTLDKNTAEDAFQKFLAAESSIHSNPRQSYSLFRQVIEITGFAVEAKRLLNDKQAGSFAAAYEIASKTAKDHSSGLNCKTYIKRRLEHNNLANKLLKPSLDRCREYIPETPSDVLTAGDLPYILYKEACKGTHSEEESYFRDPSAADKALAIASSLFLMIQFLTKKSTDIPFDTGIIPVNGYFRIPKQLYGDLGIPDYSTHKFFISSDSGSVQWYIGKYVTHTDAGARRDTDSLDRLWNRCRTTPAALLRPVETIRTARSELHMYILPSAPLAFSAKTLKKLSFQERLDIALALADALEAMHTSDPPMSHRSLSPQDILICRQGQYIKPVIIGFRSVKFEDPQSGTVIATVRNRAEDLRIRSFIAPEILCGNAYDPLKADVYSFGELLAMIFCDELAGSDPVRDVLSRFIDDMRRISDPENRPDIGTVKQLLLNDLMSGRICYAYSNIGTRHYQEDAFYIGGAGAFSDDNTDKCYVPSSPCVLAVFDGIASAEMSAEIALAAARSLGSSARDLTDGDLADSRKLCLSLADDMEHAVLRVKADNELFRVGTTAAIAIIADGQITVMNIGDSRIYRLRGRKLTLLTKDHRYSPGKGLSQYLGITGQMDICLAPYIDECPYRKNDILLICTDGLSEKLDASEITAALRAPSLKEAADSLKQRLNDKGITDNTTFLLYGVQQ